MSEKELTIRENIFEEQEKLSRIINKELTDKKILTINILGSPGAGKTSFIIETIKFLNRNEVFVIEGDIQSRIDTEKLQNIGINAYQINTGGECHLDSFMIKDVINTIELRNYKYIFIENIGNLVCPAEFNIGEHFKILVCSVTEGSDKPYKYPIAFKNSSVLILNKIDLLKYVDFDLDYFIKGVKLVNSNIEIFKISCKLNDEKNEIKNFVKWLKNKNI